MPEYDWCGTDDEPPPDSIPAPDAHLFTPGHMHDHATTGFDIAAVENEYCVASPDPVVWPGRGDVSSTSASESESEEADGAEEEWTGSSAAESESEAGTDKINAAARTGVAGPAAFGCKCHRSDEGEDRIGHAEEYATDSGTGAGRGAGASVAGSAPVGCSGGSC